MASLMFSYRSFIVPYVEAALVFCYFTVKVIALCMDFSSESDLDSDQFLLAWVNHHTRILLLFFEAAGDVTNPVKESLRPTLG